MVSIILFHTSKETIKKAFLKSIPILCSYVFVIIFIDNWEKTKNHAPAVLGLIISMLCLIIAGERSFMLPSLILVSGVLLLMREKEAQS